MSNDRAYTIIKHNLSYYIYIIFFSLYSLNTFFVLVLLCTRIAKCFIVLVGAFILKAGTGSCTLFVSGSLCSLITGAGGGFRTLRGVALKHMVPTHKTTLVASNCPGIDAFQWETAAACAFVNVFTACSSFL